MRVPKAAWGLVKEIARHLLRRPVTGLNVVATTREGHYVLIRRGDTGEWCFPGGTLEWGETLRAAMVRELDEEAGVDVIEPGALLGATSDPARDPRFHAVTLIVGATVTEPTRAPMNSLEILEVRAFAPHELPVTLSHGMTDVLAWVRAGERRWE